MRRAGGIIAIVFGVFCLLPATGLFVTGGFGEAFDAEGAEVLSLLGFGALVFCFFSIALGLLCAFVPSKLPGSFLVVLSIISISSVIGLSEGVWGSNSGPIVISILFLLMFMLFAGAGGGLALFDRTITKDAVSDQSPRSFPEQAQQGRYCRFCGRQQRHRAQFCSGCGSALV